MQKKALKVYRKIPKKLNGIIPEEKHALYPRYADIKHPNDIHYLGKESVIPENKKEKTGFATIGFPKEGTQLEKRREFEELLRQVLLRFDDVDSRDIITEVLGDDWIEEDDEYKNYEQEKSKFENDMKALNQKYFDRIVTRYGNESNIDNIRHKGPRRVDELLIEYNLDNDKDLLKKYNQESTALEMMYHDKIGESDDTDVLESGYDVQRDSSAEFRARKLTPQQILPYIESDRSNVDNDSKDVVKMFNDKISKKDILREMRKRGYSPYALTMIAEEIDDDDSHENEMLPDMLDYGIELDDMRNFLNNIFKREDQYISDLRMKSLIPYINRRF
jgi:hypothetical protein